MSDHRIEKMHLHSISIPAKAVHSHGSGDVGHINAVLCELITDTGLTGWGEASPWPVFTGTVEAAEAALHVHMRPHVIGRDPLMVEAILYDAGRAVVRNTEAKAALECALLDIAGQIAGSSGIQHVFTFAIAGLAVGFVIALFLKETAPRKVGTA